MEVFTIVANEVIGLSAAVAAGGIGQLILLERNFDSGSFSKKRRNQNHTK